MPDAIWAVSRLPPDSSRDSGLAPVSTPLEFVTTRHQRFAHARLPDPHLDAIIAAPFRSAHHERHLTDAACGGLGPPPAGRPQRTYLHLLHNTASGSSMGLSAGELRGTVSAPVFFRPARCRGLHRGSVLESAVVTGESWNHVSGHMWPHLWSPPKQLATKHR
jgi:hypothetical protein